MSGRRLHDALLRVLTSAELRARLAGTDGPLIGGALAPEDVEALRGADPDRLRRLARFLGRHFYRERIVRLFAASRRLAREAGEDPLALLATSAFDARLEAAEVGSAETADAIAALVEARLVAVLGERPYARDLVGYEGTLFRVEAGPRRWQEGEPQGEVPCRAPSARVLDLEWDVTPLVAAARRADTALPDPVRQPTRLLVALSPDGRVMTVRCDAALVDTLGALDGRRSTAAVATRLGWAEPDVSRLLRQLTEIGAVEWCRPGG